MDKIKALLDELAAVVAEMEAMTEDAPEGEAPAEPMSDCLLYTSPSPRDGLLSRMPSSA